MWEGGVGGGGEESKSKQGEDGVVREGRKQE